MANQNDYDARGEMLIRREEAKLERSKARAEALEKNMEETIAGFLKRESTKKALAREAMAATNSTGKRDDIFDKAGDGTYSNDREVITGDEPRPWERS